MKYERYKGTFGSYNGVLWKVVIMQDATSAFRVQELRFPFEEPLTIEWGETSKEDVIVSSTATLRIISPGDRTYEDLYTIEVGKIRLDVYRNDVLYWSGALDPEFYEEPYTCNSDYEVELTFSDFGILDRLKYNLAGRKNCKELLNYILGKSQVNFLRLDESGMSTRLPTSSVAGLAQLDVRSDNFYDEDGEALSLKEVAEGFLRPLGLRLEQRNGIVWLYDLNGAYNTFPVKKTEWQSDDQMMGTDKVVNNAKITWSTYAQSGNLSAMDCWTTETNPNLVALNNLDGGSANGARYFSYHYSTDYWDWADGSDAGFTIWTSRNGKNATLINSSISFFKIVPQYDGTEAEGIAIYFTSVLYWKIGNKNNYTAQIQTKGYGYGYLPGYLGLIGPALYKNESVWIPPVDSSDKLCIRVAMDLCVDPRFNFNEEGVDWMKYMEQKDWCNKWNARGNFIYVPVMIFFEAEDGNVYVWDNRNIVAKDVKGAQVSALSQTYGTWVKFNGNTNAPNAWGYLAYYQPDDRAEKSGVLGWRKNRPAINPHTGKIISVLAHCQDGQYIPYPNFGSSGGKLWIEVRAGSWMISDGNKNLSSEEVMNPYELWGKINWVLAKLPEVEIMNNVQFDSPINTDDVEYKSVVNDGAKEDLEIDTICGSSAEGVPTARGAYFNALTGKQITQMERAGRTTQIEELLIGTLYSQFAERKTKLEGSVTLNSGNISLYRDAMQDGKKFICLSDVQDLKADISEVSIVELRPDEYTESKE